MPQLLCVKRSFRTDDPEKHLLSQLTGALFLIPDPIDRIIIRLVQSFFYFVILSSALLISFSVNLSVSELM